MLTLSATTQAFIAIEPIDFRCGIDRLASVCRHCLDQNPMNGAVFVFRNRRRTAVKILCYDGQGFWLCQKRWSSGRLKWWPNSGQASQAIAPRQLLILLWNGDPTQAAMSEDWRPVSLASAAV
jgi:transposase